MDCGRAEISPPFEELFKSKETGSSNNAGGAAKHSARKSLGNPQKQNLFR